MPKGYRVDPFRDPGPEWEASVSLARSRESPAEAAREGGNISIVYRLRLNEDGWKVYDVTVDGVSLVTT